jgi:hypothetical protein
MGYRVTVSTPGLYRVYTVDTGGKGQKVGEYGRLHGNPILTPLAREICGEQQQEESSECYLLSSNEASEEGEVVTDNDSLCSTQGTHRSCATHLCIHGFFVPLFFFFADKFRIRLVPKPSCVEAVVGDMHIRATKTHTATVLTND